MFTPANPAGWSYGDGLQLLAFSLGNDWYAIETSWVRAIEREVAITPVPRAPVWLAGVFNQRGTLVPAVDPRPLLGLSPREAGSTGLLVVFDWEGKPAALAVDWVDEVYDVARSSLEPQMSTADSSRAHLFVGQVRVRDRLIGVLNVRSLMAEVA
jgi:purine-binding chemotaxis protein CheW